MADHIDALQNIRLGIEMDRHCLDDADERLAALDAAIAALAQGGAVDECCRFFSDGPENSFFTRTHADAERLIKAAGFDRDDWTVTDLRNPTDTTPAPGGAEGVKINSYCAHCLSTPGAWGMICCDAFMRDGNAVQMTEQQRNDEHKRRAALSPKEQA